MTVHTITGLGNTDTDPGMTSFLDYSDLRSPMVMAGDTLRFDPNVSTTLTIDNSNLMPMGTLQMRPASASVIHELIFANVNELLFSGAAPYPITAVSGSGTTRTFTLTLRSLQTSHNLTALKDKLVLAGLPSAFTTGANAGARPITAVTANTVTVTFGADPGAAGSLSLATGVGQGPIYNDKGLWVMGGGQLDAIGTAKLPWTRAAGNIAAGVSSVVCQDALTGWLPGDEIRIVPSDTYVQPWLHYDTLTVQSVSGSTVTFTTPTVYAHPSITIDGILYGAEILNLTRNVIIRGQDATHRVHTMFMNAVNTVQTCKYVRMKFMGPREAAPANQGTTRKITGRWVWHFHKNADRSIGGLLEGCVATDTGSHAFVQHASNGTTLLNCIADHVLEEPYWWDTDTDADASGTVLWNHCVGSDVTDTAGQNRLAAFLFTGVTDDLLSECRDCVGVAVHSDPSGPGKQNGAFVWRQLGITSGGWKIGGVNVGHNNKHYGLFTWNNGPPKHNPLDGFVLYRNGVSGAFDGAYGPRFHWNSVKLADNGWARSGAGAAIESIGGGQLDEFGKATGMKYMFADSMGHQDYCYSTGIVASPEDNHKDVRDSDFRNPRVSMILVNSSWDAHPLPMTRQFVRIRCRAIGESVNRELLPTDWTFTLVPNVPNNLFLVQYQDNSSGHWGYQWTFPDSTIASVTLTYLDTPFASYVSTASLPPATTGVAYTPQTLQAALTVGATTWRVIGSLPAGLTLTSGGVLSSGAGVVTAAPGTYPVTVEVEDSMGYTAPKDFAFVVGGVASLQITNSTLLPAYIGTAYSDFVLADGGQTPYTFARVAGVLPPGLSLISATGEIAGNPTTVNNYPFTIEVTDALGARATQPFTIGVSNPNPSITTLTLRDGEVGVSYADRLFATGGTGPYTYSSVGAPLPTGVSLSSAGVFSGSPTVGNTYPVRLRVTDSFGRTGDKDMAIMIAGALALPPLDLPSGSIGVPYFFDVNPVGGLAPFEFTLLSGELPPGLFIDLVSGVISGNPALLGTFAFTLIVHDSLGVSATQPYAIIVGAFEVVVSSLIDRHRAFSVRGQNGASKVRSKERV